MTKKTRSLGQKYNRLNRIITFGKNNQACSLTLIFNLNRLNRKLVGVRDNDSLAYLNRSRYEIHIKFDVIRL